MRLWVFPFAGTMYTELLRGVLHAPKNSETSKSPCLETQTLRVEVPFPDRSDAWGMTRAFGEDAHRFWASEGQPSVDGYICHSGYFEPGQKQLLEANMAPKKGGWFAGTGFARSCEAL